MSTAASLARGCRHSKLFGLLARLVGQAATWAGKGRRYQRCFMQERGVNIPEDLTYTPTHEWIRRTAEGVTIGISDYAQSELTDIVFVDLTEVGVHVNAGHEMCIIESVKAVAYIYAPLAGTIAVVNESLRKQPELINQDPYGEGWLVKITPDEPEHSVVLLTPIAYRRKLIEGD